MAKPISPAPWLLCVAALAFLAAFSATATTPHEPAPPTEIAVDELLVYANGFCQVFRSTTLNVVDGEATLDLPASTLVDTLRIDGIRISEVASRDPSQSFLPGDRLRVTTDHGTFTGRVLGFQSYLALDTGNGTRYLDPQAIRSIEVLEAAAPAPGTLQVHIRTDAADGAYEVRVSFILRGLTWHAVHDLDVVNADLHTWAVITGSPGLHVDRLKLVSGSPRFVVADTDSFRLELMSGASDTASTENQWTPGSLDEYHEYALGRPIDLPVARDVRLTLFDGHVDLRHEIVGYAYSYGGSVSFRHEWTFKNPQSEPLPPGTLGFYKDARFIGQDRLAYLPRSEEATVVSGDALDLKGQVTNTCTGTHSERYDVSVTNRKSERVGLRLHLTLQYQSRLVWSNPTPGQTGDALDWQLTLEPDETREVHAEARVVGDRPCPP